MNFHTDIPAEPPHQFWAVYVDDTTGLRISILDPSLDADGSGWLHWERTRVQPPGEEWREATPDEAAEHEYALREAERELRA